ncbi:MAG: hypothetical protein Q8O52_01690 [Sulfuritalea sp.]|nr:hypothetical protein [Sulfuritalea sp.]
MSHPNILVTDQDGIVTIEISRREKKNAITGNDLGDFLEKRSPDAEKIHGSKA